MLTPLAYVLLAVLVLACPAVVLAWHLGRRDGLKTALGIVQKNLEGL